MTLHLSGMPDPSNYIGVANVTKYKHFISCKIKQHVSTSPLIRFKNAVAIARENCNGIAENVIANSAHAITDNWAPICTSKPLY